MRRIVYESVASAPMTEHELMQLLAYARGRNLREQITGMLVYAEPFGAGDTGRFIQCIEGPEHEIKSLIARIIADDRHYEINILVDEPIQERLFTGWAMGQRSISASDYDSFCKLAEASQDALRRIADPQAALELLAA